MEHGAGLGGDGNTMIPVLLGGYTYWFSNNQRHFNFGKRGVNAPTRDRTAAAQASIDGIWLSGYCIITLR